MKPVQNSKRAIPDKLCPPQYRLSVLNMQTIWIPLAILLIFPGNPDWENERKGIDFCACVFLVCLNPCKNKDFKNLEIQECILSKKVWKSNLLYGGGGGTKFFFPGKAQYNALSLCHLQYLRRDLSHNNIATLESQILSRIKITWRV